MSAHRLNRRLVLEAAERAPDGAGGFVETWQPLGTLWANLHPRAGRLARGETGAHSVKGFTITVPAAPAGASNRPQAGQRFVMGARVFRIEAVSEDADTGLYLKCYCEEETAT